MLKFDKDWPQEIADITGSPEYQTATLRIEDPNLLSDPDEAYDVDTGEWTYTGDPVIYQGQARIIGVRWGIQLGTSVQANEFTIKWVRFQIPYDAVGAVNTGCRVFVESAPRNPRLTEYAYTITGDFQGSSAATRTFEANLDEDSRVVTP